MRFEVVAAFAMGILLPVLETGRRGIGHWAINFTTMFEDYFAGALLLVGAWATYRARSWGLTFLLLAWAWLTGSISSSFWSQLEETLRHTASEPNNLLVVTVKFLLWITCVVALVLSFRRAIRGRTA
jgi:hypothetical protein